MRTQSIRLALAIVLLCPIASAQWVQTNGLNERQVPHHPWMGTNVSQETPRELLEHPPQHRMQAEFINRLDSLRASRLQSLLPDGKSIPNGVQRNSPPLRRVSSPQSQIYVIDTAIVRSTTDTTRHLYSFNASAKRTTDLTQKLKGDLWVDTLRETNTYDASNNLVSDFREYRSNGQWVNSLRETYTYDASGNVLSYLNEEWQDGQLVSSYRWTYTYNGNGNRLSELYEYWNGQWVNFWRETYTYDASGNVLSYLNENWQNGQWVTSSRETYTYDANGKMLADVKEERSWGQLVTSSRWTYTYDANGNRYTGVHEYRENLNNSPLIYHSDRYTYDANSNVLSLWSEQWDNLWLNYSCGRGTYTYDANGNRLYELYEVWTGSQWMTTIRNTWTYDANGNMLTYFSDVFSDIEWVGTRRYTYTYQANGDRLSELFEDWKVSWVGLVELVSSYRWTYTYNGNGNRLSELYEYWNGQWMNSLRETYTYDAQGNLTSFWHYAWLNSSWTPTDVTGGVMGGYVYFSVTDSAGNIYAYQGYNLTFTRKLVVTGIAFQSTNVPAVYSLFQNYPNPFNPSTTIKFELPKASQVTLSVFDILGRQASVLVNERREAGVHEVKFDGSNLASGVYFYRIEAGSFVQTSKLLLIR
jgi:YD repeat-containing protein